MNSTTLLIVLAVIVLIVTIAFVVLSVKKSDAGNSVTKKAVDHTRSGEYTSDDIRSKKIKCRRCGGEAFGVLGTGNIYRCRSCGDKTQGPSVEPRHT